MTSFLQSLLDAVDRLLGYKPVEAQPVTPPIAPPTQPEQPLPPLEPIAPIQPIPTQPTPTQPTPPTVEPLPPITTTPVFSPVDELPVLPPLIPSQPDTPTGGSVGGVSGGEGGTGAAPSEPTPTAPNLKAPQDLQGGSIAQVDVDNYRLIYFSTFDGQPHYGTADEMRQIADTLEQYAQNNEYGQQEILYADVAAIREYVTS